MTRFGYRTLMLGLLAIIVGGIASTAWFSWSRARVGPEVSCTEWAQAPEAGRFRLVGCTVQPLTDSVEGATAYAIVGDESAVGNRSASESAGIPAEILWQTTDPDILAGALLDDRGRRTRQRLRAQPATFDIHGDVFVDDYSGADIAYQSFVIRDVKQRPLSPWTGLIFLFFGLPLWVLIRKQRKWRTARIAWERSKGILTEGDRPVSF